VAPRAARWAAVLLALALVVACSDDDSGGSTSSTSSTTTTTVATVAGCGTPVPKVDDRHLVHGSLESSGGTREYIVYVPDSYDPDAPAPVAYVFHGSGSNKEQQLVYSNFMPYAEADGALLVLPDGKGEPRRRWSPLGPAFAGVEGVNDNQFFTDLLAEVESSWCADPARVLVSGMSSGGFMSAAVACTHSSQVTTVGPVAATVWAEPLCGKAEPVPYVYFHGTADPVVPYDGGPNSGGPVLETSQRWADQNGCEGEPVDERIGTEVVHRHWVGCEASTDLYTVEGGCHTWPGAMDTFLGSPTQDIDATAIIWEMFKASWPDDG